MDEKTAGMKKCADSFGEIYVPEDRLWGAQTQRSLQNFGAGEEKMPMDIVRAIALIKSAAAEANRDPVPGRMSEEKAAAIVEAAAKIVRGELDGHFPLSVWQTGSGTQTNMNVNEVIANAANAAAGKTLLHPNDDVNMSQSTNDVFPSAIHLSFILKAEKELIPALDGLYLSLSELSVRYRDCLKCGRTHMQDAVELTFGQEVGGWAGAVRYGRDALKEAVDDLRALPLGGTAVGNGINAPELFPVTVCGYLSKKSGTRVYPDPNFFHSMSMKSRVLKAHSALKNLAFDLMKIANDIRMLSSGPRCGLGEIRIPANEPGSSIMPGKVNPTQCEALIMVCMRVVGNDAAVSLAGGSGSFELNVAMPLIAYSCMQSLGLLSDAVLSFTERCVSGITANETRMRQLRDSSLMNVTALSPVIGYDKAARIAKNAEQKGITLRESCSELGILTPEEYDRLTANPDPSDKPDLKSVDYTVRSACFDDIPELLRIYAAARQYMKDNGNPGQWGEDRPVVGKIRADIAASNMHIIECAGRAVGAFALIPGEDPTYAVIEDGSWLDTSPYCTVHRIASDGSVRGVFDAALLFCLSKTAHIRIDTHKDNKTMLRLLAARGFSRRGIIHLENGDERIAFERI